MRVYKVVLWGTRGEYDIYRKWIEVEVLKGNMRIEAIVLNEAKLFRRIDGITVIGIEKITQIDFDFIINLNQNEDIANNVRRIIGLLRIPAEKVIPIRVLGLPFFDFSRWIQVRNSEVSVLSSHCWGGFVYNTLGLKFGTPLVNMFFDNNDFFRFLTDVKGYMQQPLRLIGEEYEENLKRNYPVVGLGDVTIHFNHYTDFNEAVQIWERRKKRINYNNLLVQMFANTGEDIERFLEMPYEHKICFTMLPYQEKEVISVHNPYFLNLYGGEGYQFALATAMTASNELKQYDLLKLLNHEKDYRRAEIL